MFSVYWTNHGYAAQEEFTTLADAVAYGVKAHFEFSVWQDGNRVASWTVFGGLRTY